MGLTIHYALHAQLRSPRRAKELMEQLRSKALDLSFTEVGEVVELVGRECMYEKREGDDPLRWLLTQARQIVVVGDEYHQVRPDQLVAFSTWPGEGCEQANFGLAVYPKTGEVQDWSGRTRVLPTGIKGWSWKSFCKTQYASEPRKPTVADGGRTDHGVLQLAERSKGEGSDRRRLDLADQAGQVRRYPT